MDSIIISSPLVEQAMRENRILRSFFQLCTKTGRLGLGGESDRPWFTLYIQLAHVVCFGINERNEKYRDISAVFFGMEVYSSNLCICVWIKSYWYMKGWNKAIASILCPKIYGFMSHMILINIQVLIGLYLEQIVWAFLFVTNTGVSNFSWHRLYPSIHYPGKRLPDDMVT